MATFLTFFAVTRNILHPVYIYKSLIYNCISGIGEGEGNILKIVTRARIHRHPATSIKGSGTSSLPSALLLKKEVDI